MAGAALRYDSKEARRRLDQLRAVCWDVKPTLLRIGQVLVQQTKARFQANDWPPKHPIFAEWEGKDEELIYRGHLMQSITAEVSDRGLRVGSALQYAATHQFGDDRERRFYVYNIPEYEPGERAERRVARYANGWPKGRLTTKADYPGQAVRTLVVLHSIRKRPFLKAPEGGEAEEIYDVIERQFNKALGGGRQ